jgi:hypothetical protein
MTYTPPQLLTIGNATNLVLGDNSHDPRCVSDSPFAGSFTPELW